MNVPTGLSSFSQNFKPAKLSLKKKNNNNKKKSKGVNGTPEI